MTGASVTEVVYDLLIALLMLAGAIIYSAYMAGWAANFSARSSYNVYDGSVYSRARWLLPTKADYSTAVSQFSAQQKLTFETGFKVRVLPVAAWWSGGMKRSILNLPSIVRSHPCSIAALERHSMDRGCVKYEENW